MDINKILAVVVLYNRNISESSTVISLNNFLEEKLDILVYDNSLEYDSSWSKEKFENLNIEYIHDPCNEGIAKAYNFTLKRAIKKGKKWIMLLDHDTNISALYLSTIKCYEDTDLNVVCLVPFVQSRVNNKIISPVKLNSGGFVSSITNTLGLLEGKITSINSASVLSVNYMANIGGFNEEYPLDMLDYWYFKQIYIDKRKIYLLNVTLSHDLSVEDRINYVPITRYRELLKAESKFFKNDGRMSFLLFKMRLALRVLKQIVSNQTRYAKFTLLNIMKMD